MSEADLVFIKEMPHGKFLVYNHKPDLHLNRVKQVHSAVVVDESDCAPNMPEADAIVGNSSTPMAILTADCLPILLVGKNGHAMVHAGWRGLHNEILKQEKIKSLRPFYAFIGPHISMPAYEVQPDFRNNFNIAQAFMERNGKLFFSLEVVAKIQLKALNPNILIESSGQCTFFNEKLNSYRRNKTTERNWNIYIP